MILRNTGLSLLEITCKIRFVLFQKYVAYKIEHVGLKYVINLARFSWKYNVGFPYRSSWRNSVAGPYSVAVQTYVKW